MTIDGDVRTSVLDTELTRRALRVVLDKTTEMAEDILRVPLHYYRDPKITEIEEAQILRRTPLAIVSSAQVANPNDYVVRSVLGDSLQVTRDKEGVSHVLLNYCRHRGAMPACGAGSATRFTCPYHAWTYKNDGKLFTVPGNAGFSGMDKADYGLVELPNQERHGFIWAVPTADADIDVDEHLGPRVPATDDATRAGYDMIFNAVHAAVRDEDFVMLPQCGEGVRQGQHDHMVIGRNEIGVQHMIRVFAQELGVALD